MPQRGHLPGFIAEAAISYRSASRYRQTPTALGAAGPKIWPAGCDYYYGTCAGKQEFSCEFGDSSGICVGEGYAPVVVTCDGDVSYTEVPCVV